MILITAFGGALVAEAARRYGASRYLEKPVRVAELVVTVRSVLGRDDRPPAVTLPAGPVDRLDAELPRPEVAIRRRPPARLESTSGSPGRLWAIVLAGGQGVRLRPLTRYLHGDARPKQYAKVIGGRSLLGQTLDRVALRIPQERTVVVGLRDHATYLDAEFAGSAGPRLLLQPEDRGTAAGVLFPAHWIQWRDPDATIAVFPSDHFVREEQTFLDHVIEAAGIVSRHPQWSVVLGSQPTEPESAYGWIEPGDTLDLTARGPIRRVRRFLEKPPAETARAYLAAGGLWNTFVLVGKVAALVEASRQLPWGLHGRLVQVAPFAGTDYESRAIRRAYASAPHADFARTILENCTSVLAVLALTDVTWCDWVVTTARHPEPETREDHAPGGLPAA